MVMGLLCDAAVLLCRCKEQTCTIYPIGNRFGFTNTIKKSIFGIALLFIEPSSCKPHYVKCKGNPLKDKPQILYKNTLKNKLADAKMCHINEVYLVRWLRWTRQRGWIWQQSTWYHFKIAWESTNRSIRKRTNSTIHTDHDPTNILQTKQYVL